MKRTKRYLAIVFVMAVQLMWPSIQALPPQVIPTPALRMTITNTENSPTPIVMTEAIAEDEEAVTAAGFTTRLHRVDTDIVIQRIHNERGFESPSYISTSGNDEVKWMGRVDRRTWLIGQAGAADGDLAQLAKMNTLFFIAEWKEGRLFQIAPFHLPSGRFVERIEGGFSQGSTWWLLVGVQDGVRTRGIYVKFSPAGNIETEIDTNEFFKDGPVQYSWVPLQTGGWLTIYGASIPAKSSEWRIEEWSAKGIRRTQRTAFLSAIEGWPMIRTPLFSVVAHLAGGMWTIWIGVRERGTKTAAYRAAQRNIRIWEWSSQQLKPKALPLSKLTGTDETNVALTLYQNRPAIVGDCHQAQGWYGKCAVQWSGKGWRPVLSVWNHQFPAVQPASSFQYVDVFKQRWRIVSVSETLSGGKENLFQWRFLQQTLSLQSKVRHN